MKSFAFKLIFAATLFLSASVCHAQKWLTFDEHVEGRFPYFGANTNLAATTTNNAGHAWRLVGTNQIRVPQNSVLVVSGRHRGIAAATGNMVYGFSGSQNAINWSSNVLSATVVANTSFITNTFTVIVGTNIPHRYICWDRSANQDATAYTNEFLAYTFYPYRQSP